MGVRGYVTCYKTLGKCYLACYMPCGTRNTSRNMRGHVCETWQGEKKRVDTNDLHLISVRGLNFELEASHI